MARPGYQEEPVHLGYLIWEKGFITPWQLLRIASWKSARGLGNLSLLEPRNIEVATGATVQAASPYRHATSPPSDDAFWQASEEAWRHLDDLYGVDLPLASAVLCILNPCVWPVVDRRAAESVFGAPVHPRFDFYRAYITRLAELLLEHAEIKTVHELDQALYRRPDPLPVEIVDWRSRLEV